MTATSTDLLLPEPEAIWQHLDVLTRRWPELDEPCLLETVFLSADDVAAVKDVQHYTADAEGLAAAAAHVAAMNGHGINTYAVVNPVSALNPPSVRKRAAREHILGSFFHWADADDEAAAQNIKDFVSAKCTFYVITGTHPFVRPHVYWELEEPTRNLEAWVTTQKAIAAALGTDRAVTDPPRIMRLAGTINWPKPQKRAKGYIAELTRLRVYDPDERPPISSERMARAFGRAPHATRKPAGDFRIGDTGGAGDRAGGRSRAPGAADAYVKQDRVSVVPQVSGEIDRVMVGENEVVTAGETLFTIDPAVYRSVADEDRAKLESARLGVEKLKAAYAQAVSEAATAREALATAATQNDRQRALLASGVVPQATADDSALKLQQAKGALAQAESRVLSARAALAGDPDIATDRHPAVMEALATLRGAELDLANTTVRAPADGVVSQTARLQPGQYVTPAVPVLALVATADTWIEANFKETDLTHMVEGQPVEVTLDTFPDRVLKGEIGSIGAGTGSEFALLPAQNASGNWVKVVQRVPLRVHLEDGQDLPALRTGMSASVEVDTGNARGLPRVVTHALAAIGIGGSTAVAAPAR